MYAGVEARIDGRTGEALARSSRTVPLTMTAQNLADTRLVDGIPAHRLFEGLSSLYRWIIVTDGDRRILWMSNALRELVGDEELALGADARNYIPKLPKPEQVFSLRSKLRHRGALAGVVLDVATRDGDVVEVEANLFKLETGRSEPPLIVSIARPIESDAQRDAGIATIIVDTSPDAVVAVDRHGFVTHANPAAERLLGRTRDELTGSAAALLFGESAREIERIAASLGTRSEPAECEMVIGRAEGGVTRLVTTVSPLPEDIGGCVLFLREATGRDEVVADLRRANAELEHCVNALAHDLRSPLVALLGFSRLLRQDYGSHLDDTGCHFLDRIEQAGRTMEGLIHDLLELSRIGQPGEHPAMVDPRAVLQQLHAEFKPRLDARGIRLALPEMPPPLVYCDRTRLYQVFSNLIGNAIDHMGDTSDPRIEVAVVEAGDGHDIVVRDNGRGIPYDQHERIFEVFQSLGARNDGRAGTGIGLAIVKKIAEIHGGCVWVESEPGRGSAFHVHLPRR